MSAIHSLLPMDTFGPLLDGRPIELMVLANLAVLAAGIVAIAWLLVRRRRRD